MGALIIAPSLLCCWAKKGIERWLASSDPTALQKKCYVILKEFNAVKSSPPKGEAPSAAKPSPRGAGCLTLAPDVDLPGRGADYVSKPIIDSN